MVIDPNLPSALEAARRQAGLTKYRVAIISGLSPQTVRSAFQGVATTRTLNALARAMGVSLDVLTGRKGQS